MVKFDQISNSVWAHTGGDTFGHIAFVKLESSVVFVDSGYFPKLMKEARKEAEKITGLPVKYLIITHHHSDHILGNQFFDDCEIISTKDTLDFLENLIKTRWTDEFIENFKKEDPENFDILKISLPNKVFEVEYEIKERNSILKVIQTDGHTKGSCFVYIPSESIIIAGDLLFSEEIPYFGDRTADPYLWIEAYQKMINLSPIKIVPGHGPITDIKQMEIQLQYMKDCINWMEKYIESGGKKEDLEKAEDFPMLDYEPYENFDVLFKSSKERTYDIIIEKFKN
jgi:glyoxylase-like metal-dependent hydrolase (beta-lactamase superfamily II)